jgi:CHAT domain-containing protein
MNSKAPASRVFLGPFFLSCALLGIWVLGQACAEAQTDPLALQQEGIRRLESYIEHFRKTGDQQSRLPDLARAEADLAASQEEFLRQRDDAAAALSVTKMGDVRRIRNQPRPALDCYEQGLRLARKAKHRTNEVLALLGRARAEAYVLKDFPAAATHFGEAVRLSADLPDRTHLFNALSGLGNVQVGQGDMIAAADTYNRAFTLTSGLKDEALQFYAYLDRGEVYQKLAEKCDYERTFQPCYEQLDLAKKDYSAALGIARKLGYTGLARTTEEFLKELEFRREMFRSQERLGKMLQQSGIFHPQRPGDVLVSEQFAGGAGAGFPPGAMAALQQSGVISVGDARSFFIRGSFHSLQREYPEALAAYLKSVELLETDRRRLREDTGSRAFLDDRINFYYAPIELLLQERRFAEAFTLMEQSRSRALTDLLFSKKLVLASPEEAADFGQLQSTRSRIALLQKEVFEIRTRADSEGFADQVKPKEAEIAQLQGEYEKIAGKAPKLQELIASGTVSLAQFQQTLKKNSCDVLYYLVLEQAVLLWHINEDDLHVRSVFLPRSEVINKVAALQKSLSQRDARFDERTAKELFLYLIQPALGWIKSKHVVIIPHEDLHYVPFQVFLDPTDNTALGERFQVTYAPNATLLAQMKTSGPINQGRLLAVADKSFEDEERGEIEGLRLQELYPGRHRVLTNATKAEFKQVVGQYDLLHLSVHGVFRANEPLLSYVQLVPGGTDDGQLTAAEIFGLPLNNARLIVLSACETGQAEATHANEILGMQRALLYAGANALILSAWEVDAASTGLWMQTFYREAQQKSPAEAARLSLIKVKREYPHPHHWAPFQIIGK